MGQCFRNCLEKATAPIQVRQANIQIMACSPTYPGMSLGRINLLPIEIASLFSIFLSFLFTCFSCFTGVRTSLDVHQDADNMQSSLNKPRLEILMTQRQADAQEIEAQLADGLQLNENPGEGRFIAVYHCLCFTARPCKVEW